MVFGRGVKKDGMIPIGIVNQQCKRKEIENERSRVHFSERRH